MYFDQRGPLIFSASIHFAVVIFFLIKSMIEPDKPPEEMIFILTPPPSSAAPQERVNVEYKAEEFEMPDIPKPPPVIPNEPEPIVERREEITIPVETEKPKPAPTSYKDFLEKNTIKEQDIPKRQPPKGNDLTKVVDRLQKNLSQLSEINLPSTVLDGISAVDQNKLATYFAALKQAILDNVESHPLSGSSLKTKVTFILSPTGDVSGAIVVSGSGDAEFDRKVIDGFRRFRRIGNPPGLTRTESLTMTINQID